MNAIEAKNLLASFLVGGRVSRNDLEQARNILASDGPYRRFFGEAMGSRGSWVSECDGCLSRVAELAELSSDEQQRRFPVLYAHLSACASCREVYWTIRPTWYDIGPSTTLKVQALQRRLTEHVELAMDKMGRILDRAIGVPPVRTNLVATTAASAVVEPQIREWELRDEDAGYLIRMTLSVVAPGATLLTAAIEETSPGISGPTEARIELRDQNRDVLVVSGRLLDFETEPITLVGEGLWLVHIERSDDKGCHVWEMPVKLVYSEPDQPPVTSGEGTKGALMGGDVPNPPEEEGDLRPGQMLADRYSIERELGRGGMGVVYIARDRQLLSADSTRVVIKVLRPEALQDAWFKKKFFQEFESLTRLAHPNVVKVLGSGTLAGRAPYFVMEYVEGNSLSSAINQEGMDLSRAARIMRQIGQALSAVHDKGILHCDLKPDNIMLQTLDYSDEAVKLIDFGVAKVKDSMVAYQGGSTKIGGTLHYASPEHFTGTLLAVSDVYSFAVIAYEMLTGRRPFNATNEGQLCYLQLEGVKIRPSDLRPALPRAVDDILLRGLASDPNERYQRASEFAEELAQALTLSGASATVALGGGSRGVKRQTNPQSSGKRELALEIGHVLVIELADHSVLPLEQQVQQSRGLQEILRATAEFQASLENEQLISFSTGAGIALVFFRDPVAPAQCALDVARALKSGGTIKVRMGLHTGPVYRVADINLNNNVSGGAVSVAQQVAACGGPGHILLSQPVAEFLKQLENWRAHVHDGGEKRTKDGRLHLYNLYTEDVGNPGGITGKRPSKRLIVKKLKDGASAGGNVYEPPIPVAPAPTNHRVSSEKQGAGGTKAIIAQIIGVSHRRDDKGKEGLIYAQVPLAMEDAASDPIFVPIKAQVLETHIQEVRRRVEDLTRRALVGQRRGNIGIEAAADNLARQVMPPMGFGGLMGDGIHPQFDLIQDAASAIPWEVLEETYFRCPNCGNKSLPDYLRQSTQPHCSSCGDGMTRIGGKLALRYHLSHLVRGRGRSASSGKKFLFIEDPTGDLCDPSKDPDGICGEHLEQLHGLVKDQGFTIDLLRKSHASVQHVLRALSDTELIGVYYFGHGFFPRDGDEGRLVLSDGVLFASQIEDVSPAAKIVFLNACEGAATGRDWDLEKRSRSVAHAFARGGRGKVVIAPLWPVVSVQAAESALAFFRHASSGTPMAESLANARHLSLQRYEAGEPHLAWMAYRYFGDPGNTFPAPIEKDILVAARGEAPWASRVFNGKGQLDTEAFTFGIEEVLIRAAKRRNSQGRAQLTTSDLLAGLTRKGDLTRLVFRRVGVDPDEWYKANAEAIEEGAPAPAQSGPCNHGERIDETSLLQNLSKWIVRAKEDFSVELVEVLEKADVAARERQPETDDARISEHDILCSLLVAGEWRPAITVQMPPAPKVAAALSEYQKTGTIDDNGSVSLKALDRAARKIIEGAHELSQQRGVFPIPHRLLLAAFLADTKGHAARVCRCAGVDPELLFLLMIALTEKADEEHSPKSFGLSTEACERIVLPVIEQAKATERINEGGLFRAFCEKATPEFKAWLQSPPVPVDLASLHEIDPDKEEILKGLDASARKIVDTAHALAQECGVHPIPNRLLLAAFLIDPRGHAASLLQSLGVPATGLCASLIQGARSAPARSFALDLSACDRAVMPMIRRSREIASEPGSSVTEQTLFAGFCDVAPADLKNLLKRAPLKIDLDGLAKGGGQTSATSAGPTPSTVSGDNDELTLTKMGISPGKFGESTRRVLVESARIARMQGWPEVRTPHLLVALLESPTSAAAALLRGSPLPLEDVKQLVLSLVPARSPLADAVSVSFGNNVRSALERALEIAGREKREQANENDIAASLLADSGGVGAQLFGNLGLSVPIGEPSVEGIAETNGGGGSSLSRLGKDLTERARRGELPDVVGRDNEIETALQTLLLTENANPLLVGDAGVGKTAIVEGIAQRIAAGRCPPKLRPMRVVELSAGSLVANTRLRGEFEQRFQDVLAEARVNVILFIDEIHTIVGAGSAEGSGPDASNMLKTALARGEIRLIGATTHVEFKRTVARDKALSRRFQVQLINPPSRDATLRVLSARQPVLEQHHGVTITEEAKEASVDLSGRYILDRQWPAKARDVLDRACVLAASEQTTPSPLRVTREHVAKVVCTQTGIPLDRVSSGDLASLVSLEDRLAQRIVGQPNAVRAVTSAVRRGRQGLAGPNRPWGIFLFLGPPGVGKTELAKVLAEEVYGGPEGLIRFDMGDFTEPHSTARLIGAPPGYVGYDQGAPLVERLRRQPYSLLLFDEVEHAHENVLAVLLRLLSEGTLADHEGNVADGRNTVVIMTSNLLGSGPALKQMGFGAAREPLVQSSQTDLRALLERHFPPKLIDRLDAVVQFNPLGPQDLNAIARRKVAEVVARLSSLYAVSISVREEVFSWLAQKAGGGGHGARHLQRAIDDHLGPVLIAAVSNLGGLAGGVLEVALLPGADGVECLLRRS